jgi:LAO/AO transport system kinase
VLTCSAREGTGIAELWQRVGAHRQLLETTGALEARRRDQQVDWTWALVHDQLLSRLHENPEVRGIAPDLERQVREGTLTATLAAERILAAFQETGAARPTTDGAESG